MFAYRFLEVRFGKWKDPVCAVKNPANEKHPFLYSARRLSQAKENSLRYVSTKPDRSYNANLSDHNKGYHINVCLTYTYHQNIAVVNPMIPDQLQLHSNNNHSYRELNGL